MSASACGYRLPSGGLIDRSRTVCFTFNGRSLEGHPGDTLASALIANGVSLIGRSFKYHRPRGFYGAGLEDPSSMLAVRDTYGYEPALRAGQVRLCEGLEARSVTGWPSATFDLAGGLQLFAGVLSAGFYYKTFKWPTWALFEPLIKRSTGFGRPQVMAETRTAHYRHATCDVLIVGGGPGALAAARMLIGTGLKVVLADDQPQVGGCLNWEAVTLDDRAGAIWARDIAAQLAADPQFTVLTSTTVTAAYEGNHFTLVQTIADTRGVRCEYHWKLRAHRVVLASGMIDRPLLFPGNDRPGIMLSAAVRRLIGEFGVSPARALAVYTNNDSGYLTALAAARAGIDVRAVVDVRPRPQSAASHIDAVRGAGITCLFDSQITATTGYRRLSGITVHDESGRRRRIPCNGLAVSGGFTPLIHLASHRGVKPVYDAQRAVFLADRMPDGWYAAGGVTGALDLETALAQGRQAGESAAAAMGVSVRPTPIEAVKTDSWGAGAIAPLWRPNRASLATMWVDFQNDVKASDVALAVRENYLSVEHLKRYTTLGMGTDQGRTSNVNGLALLAELTGRAVDAVGTTTFRPPYTAVRMGVIANGRRGDLYRPRRLLPAHRVHEKQSAVFEDFGWQRPDWYRCNGESREAAVEAEMAAVRTRVGVFDGSTLGKIEVTGPDAAEFLSRFYVSNMATLKQGHVRYSVMLKDDGVIFDDGVVARLGENHFLASPTSGQADAVAAWLERWRQTEWPAMRVAISVVTSNWASIAIAGPRARALLAHLEPSFDIANEAFPHMEIREGRVGGVAARVARISFTGELQYEVSVPARYACCLLQGLLAVEGDLKPLPVGIEAWLRLRLEKGYLHLGSDTNGRTTPLDIGMAGIVAKRRDDFIGKRSLSLPFATSPEREQLVGLIALQGTLHVGGRILAPNHARPPCPTEGYVTSACVSPSVRASIGLALIERGHARQAETVAVYCNGAITRARICNPVFYDPANEKLRL
jgi:sarcosine oxidase subunit alpha